MSILVVLLRDGVGCKLWYSIGGIIVTSASSPFNGTLAFHELPVLPWTAYSSVSSPRKNSSSSSCLPGKFTSPTLLSNWDWQAFAECPTLEHLLHFDSLAGHSLFGCGWPRHLEHCASGVFPFKASVVSFFFFVSSLESFPFPLDKRSTWAVGGLDLVPCRNVCCFSNCLWLPGFCNCFL